ncbi:MAG: diguanylate cyclase, partial [Thermosynechococcaceae cyanobacterium]
MNQPPVRTEYEKRLTALQQCVHDLQKQDDAEKMSHTVVCFAKEWFKFDLVWLAEYDAQTRTLIGLDGMLPNPDKDRAFLRQKHPILPGDLFDQTLVTGRSQKIPSLKQEQRAGEWQVLAKRQDIQGALILPIRYRHQSLGLLLVGTT